MLILTKGTVRNNGFTIVELILVIVVIAILASITIVAYSGIRQNATNTMTASRVSTYKDLLDLYKTYEGEYLKLDEWETVVCLGPPDEYPATAEFEAGECANWVRWGSNRYSHSANEDINALLQASMKQVPSGGTGVVSVPEIELEWESITDVHYRGLIYRSSQVWDDELGENVPRSYIHYFLNGTQDCSFGTAFSYNNITECIVGLDGAPITEYDAKGNGGEG